MMTSPELPKAVPIKDISTFCSRWSVIAKVVSIEAARTFQSRKGASSKVRNVTLCDSAGDEIVGTFWGTAVDQFAHLKQGETYHFSKGSIQLSNRRYTTCPHPYQLSFNESTIVQPVEMEHKITDATNLLRKFNTDGGLRGIKSSIRPRVDFVGLVLSSAPEQQIKTKAGIDRSIRRFTVCDNTGHKIAVDVWGETSAELKTLTDAGLSGHPIVGMRNCRINEYRGKTLVATADNIDLYPQTAVDDAMPQFKEQLDWFQQQTPDALRSLVSLTEDVGGMASSQNRPNAITIPGMNVAVCDAHRMLEKTYNQDDGTNQDKEVYFRSVMYPARYFYNSIEDRSKLTCFYKACCSCGKKWSSEIGCPSCSDGKEESRYILQVALCDGTASRFQARFFGKQAEELIGMNANDLAAEDRSKIDLTLEMEALNNPVACRIKAHLNEYQGEQRLNITAINATRISGCGYVDEGLHILEALAVKYPVLAINSSSKRVRDDVADDVEVKRCRTVGVA